MSATPFNFARGSYVPPAHDARTEVVQPQKALRRILSFTGRTIDDVINDPIARSQVLGYYKLHRWIEREVDIGDLERQWNEVTRIRK